MKEEDWEEVKPCWNPATLIADRLKLSRHSVGNVISLLNQGATIPFIARYRKEMTENMEPEILREVAEVVEELKTVETKVQSVYTSIRKMGKMTQDLDTSLRCSTSIAEVETLYAPFKPGHKGTYAERARALGLEALAKDLLDGKYVSLRSAVNVSTKGLESIGDVEKGVKHIIADIVAKDSTVIEETRKLYDKWNVMIESHINKKKSAAKKTDKVKAKPGKENAKIQEQKFEQYFDFKLTVKAVKPHQILALNRGEDLKVLTVKVTVPDGTRNVFIKFAMAKYLRRIQYPENCSLVRQAIEDAYDRLIEPMMCRQIRSDLTKNAEKASINVFSSNLKNLLLTQPVKNKTILGIDPGFTNGCKLAVISPTSEVLWTGVTYLHCSSNTFQEMRTISMAVNNYRCEIITIGNGVACRETEKIVADMIKHGQFYSDTVQYCIIGESGASIYSVSDQAKLDLPELDHTLRGAVSLARRLQDPLAEFVKIEPKHLGVGMYQHDVNNNKLHTALDSVVEECVSFVGVDINTCSQSLLKKVAGLNAAKAKSLLEWRAKNGFFTNRQQLLEVKGLGKKGFEQCAGFIRVSKHSIDSGSGSSALREVKEEVKIENLEEEEAESKTTRKRKATTAGPSKKKKAKVEITEEWNPLDATAIHPESYDLAHKLASHLGVNVANIGTDTFIRDVTLRATDNNVKRFCEREKAGFATVQLIVDAFKQPLSSDFRDKFQKPLFKQEVMSLSDLRGGAEVTGQVTNVTHFGAFVDIGVGINGLIHISNMRSSAQLGVGDHVTVIVDNVDHVRKRIGLILKRG
ncbi:hypothetical protein BsWGS_15219 [Bradybaena similaris]